MLSHKYILYLPRLGLIPLSPSSKVPSVGNIIYHCCGKPGNNSTECNLKDSTPKKDWYIHNSIQHYQENENYGVSETPKQELSSTNSHQRNRRSGQHGKKNQNNTFQNYQYADQKSGWNEFQRENDTPAKMVQHKQRHKPKHISNLENIIVLDSGSTTKRKFMNTDLVTNIKPIKIPFSMSTNAGTKKMTL